MRGTVLIVEDNHAELCLLRGILAEEYNAIEVNNGQAAIDILNSKGEAISAIILDMAMTDQDGCEVLKKIQSNRMLMQLPVIVATEPADEETQKKALLYGATNFTQKPYNAPVLLQTLRNCIRLRQAVSDANSLRRDDLTGLYRREAFFDEAAGLIAAHTPGYYILSCLNVENFKVINDQYGTNIGDAVLRYVGGNIERCAKHTEGIACRYSADKFALLFPAEHKDSRFVQEVHQSIIKPDCLDRRIKIRIGRYPVEDKAITVNSMFDRASMAEESIRGRYDVYIATYHEGMLNQLLEEQQIIGEMHEALRNKQFEPWLQPQYNHASGALVGAEALTRWRHPRKGMIQPGVFVPVFERNGFIYEMDKSIWEQVCALLRGWLDAGLDPLPISVNISRFDVLSPDLVAVITGLVKAYSIPIDLLRLEITESAFESNTALIVSTIKELIDFGFIVEIDDFGSGYSSLNTLKDVPADILKLDMKFLENKEGSQRGGNILESVVRMAKWLGMSVIAEGVEEKAQADFLVSIGCNYVQGYYYAKPMPVEEYVKLERTSAKERGMSGLETVETFDNNAFWDPKSMDTLIFNSYVGGACILEYYDGKTEMLRANGWFMREFDWLGKQRSRFTDLSPESCLDAKNLRVLYDNIGVAIVSRTESTCELQISEEKTERVLYMRCTVRMIAQAGSRYLIYCVLTNISKMRIAEKKQREAEQKRAAAAERLAAIMDSIDAGVTAIVMHEDARTELIFVNNRFYDMIGYTQEEYRALGVKALELMNPDDYAVYGERLLKLNKVGQTMNYEFRVKHRDGRWIWIQGIVVVMRFVGVDAPVQLASYTDITARKEAEEQLDFLNTLSEGLLQQPDVGLYDALQRIMEYFGGKRAYVFELDERGETFNNTYEVCAEGVSAEKDRLQNMPLKLFTLWLKKFEEQDYIYVENVEKLDDSRKAEKEILRTQGIHSLVAAPLRRDGRLIGFIGLDDSSVEVMQARRFVALGDYAAVLLTRRDLLEQMREESQSLNAIVNGMPGGFIRMKIMPGGKIKPLYISEGILKLFGMEKDDLAKLKDGIENAKTFYGVHPDDVAAASEIYQSIIQTGKTQRGQFRLQNAAGDYTWVMVVGKLRISDKGETFLNVYYSDATENRDAEKKQKALLDNLPCGAALYEYDGEKLIALYWNRHYWELVGREAVKYANAPFMNAVYQEDRPIVMRELKAAIRQGRNFSADLRILYRQNEYRPFHIEGHIELHQEGKYAIYATYTPISAEKMSLQAMLPIALSAMMASSDEYTFVKDRDLRYVCASRSTAALLGQESEQTLIGKSDYDLMQKELVDPYAADDRRVIETGEALIGKEERLPTADGSECWGRISKYPLLDSEGQVLGLFVSCQNTTKVREMESQLRLLTDTIEGGIATFAVSKSKIEMLYFNEGFYRYSGYSRAEYEKLAASDPFGWVFKQDRAAAAAVVQALIEKGEKTKRGSYRCHTKDGGYRWFSLTGTILERRGETVIISAVKYDITEQMEMEQQLRISEEEYRLATQHSEISICRYNIAEHSLTISRRGVSLYGLQSVIYGVPHESVHSGDISEDTAKVYTEFFESICNGKKDATVRFQRKLRGRWRWLEAHSSLLYSDDGEPVSAVISFHDVTEQSEKEAIYQKWSQSMENRPESSYTLFRCNLNKDTSFDSQEGALLQYRMDKKPMLFNERTLDFAKRFVYPADRERYIAFVNSDVMLAEYYRGRRMDTLEYRGLLPGGELRYLRLTIELVQYPNSMDIEAFMLYEDIDEEKREEIETKKLAENDPLTGILNRKAFAEQAEMHMGGTDTHALLMFDIDGFKLLNDSLGHDAGDQALIGTAASVQGMLRKEDLLGRLGGDEFVVLLHDIPNDEVAADKARQICALIRNDYTPDVKISASVGIAMAPRDGEDFDTLYKKADAAMYYVKNISRDSFAFYHEGIENEIGAKQSRMKKRDCILIVDDDEMTCAMLKNIFKDEYTIETAADGNAALCCLRSLGTAVSAVLLDLMMPGTDGYTVLARMQGDPSLRTIPVIVMSAQEDSVTCLRVLKGGAADFVMKPIEPDVLKMRMRAAVGKAENERRRAQNKVLAMQSEETARYRAALEGNGICVAEYDLLGGKFIYTPELAKHLAGNFDYRALWDILITDGVAEKADVNRLRALVDTLAHNQNKTEESMVLRLKTRENEKREFLLHAFKTLNAYQLANKLILTFTMREEAEDRG